MPGSITKDLIDISEADTTTGWSGSSGGLDDEVYKQRSVGTGGAYTYQTGKNGIETCTFTPAANINMTANYGTPHMYWTMRCDVFPFCEALNTGSTNSGLMVRVTDGSGNYTQWHVAGSDTWDGSWRNFVLDLTNTANVHSSSGTLSLANVDVITWYTDNSNSGTIRIIDNTWLDAVRYGDGLQANSATTEAFDFTDIALADVDVANYYGVLQETDGVLFCQGKITLGDSGGTNDTNFVSLNETVYFKDQIVDNAHYAIEGVGHASVTTDIDITGLVTKTVGNQGAELDFSDTLVDSLAIDASTFIDMGSMSFYGNATTDALLTGNKFEGCGTTTFNQYTDASGCIWNLCGLITQSGATITAASISNASGTVAVLSDNPSLITDSTFTSDGTGHAVELTGDCAGNSYDWNGNQDSGYAATDGSTGNEVIYNNSGGAVTINVINGAKTPTVRNGTGASTTVVSGTVTVQVKVIALDTGLPIENARVRVTKTVGGAVVLSGLTNASGIIQDTGYTYSSDEGIEGWARKSSSTPYYQQGNITGTITSSGFTTTVSMAKDE